METAKERQRSRRARLGEKGCKDITVTVRTDQADRVKSLARACREGCPVSLRLVPALNALRADASELGRRGVARAGVFGSVARGDDGRASDVDVVLVLEPGIQLDLLALTRLQKHVADTVARAFDDCDVDVSIRDHMRQSVRASVDREAVYAY